ncbi:MAG TPA: N-methyl-L-tryptophan oxidase [Gemmatimonadaceae bacterium]|jgi:sarcosine oxidase|nr:N-methyl-L-tryptophan oxidase [Gemmatimonadaceae bacterium]
MPNVAATNDMRRGPAPYDVIVAGLGAMGSAALYHLARRGARVLGIDRFAPPHAMGSSHGLSRIIREAYFEDPLYVPFVQRAYELWDELQREAGREILVRTGGLMIGPPDGTVAGGALRSAQRHGLPHERLSAAQLNGRFPAFRPTVDMIGVWEPRAGYLVPETAIGAHLEIAERRGAELRTGEAIVDWRATADGVAVRTTDAVYRADRLVLALGAWTSGLIGDLALPLAVERNVLYWFEPARATTLFDRDRFPVWLCEYAPGKVWYGFPDAGHGVKVALHHQGSAADPDALRRDVAPEETAYIRALLRTFMPAADGPLVETAVCMYTNTPDEHFIIDRHPTHPRVIVASPCSGHGFKFSSAVGEQLALLATDADPTFDLHPFRIGRLMGD